MPLIIWKDALKLGIGSVNNEHKQLVDTLNEFYDNITQKSNKENITKALAKLKDYTVYHFKNEESFLAQHKYPQLDTHIKEHQKFIEKVNNIEERINEGKTVLSLDVIVFLKDWVQNHIMHSDKDYAEYFADKGIKIE